MNCEDRRYPSAGPECARHLLKRQEQQDRRGGVQDRARQMVAAGLQFIKLAVQHVREPGQRVPVAAAIRGEGPGSPCAGQAPANMRVLVNVISVVEVDKVVRQRLCEDEDHRQQEKPADGQQAVGPADLSCRARGEAIDRAGGHLLRRSGIAGLRWSMLLGSSAHLLLRWATGWAFGPEISHPRLYCARVRTILVDPGCAARPWA